MQWQDFEILHGEDIGRFDGIFRMFIKFCQTFVMLKPVVKNIRHTLIQSNNSHFKVDIQTAFDKNALVTGLVPICKFVKQSSTQCQQYQRLIQHIQVCLPSYQCSLKILVYIL